MMSQRIFIKALLLISSTFFSITIANRTNRNLNLQQLQNRCLTHQSTAAKSSTCITQKKLKMQITRGVENGVFYCLTYEKNTGNVYGFDSLTIELHPDYDLQYSGANVIDYEFPSFKLYDARVTEEYKGRFAIYSNNTSFQIYQVTVNNEPQSCTYGKGKNRQLWPPQRKPIINDDDADEPIQTTQKLITTSTTNSPIATSTTTLKPTVKIETTTQSTSTTSIPTTTLPIVLTTEPIPNPTEIILQQELTTDEPILTTTLIQESKSNEEINVGCGISKKIINLKQFSIPYNPGEYPFAVSIFHKIDNEHINFKCSGTIINSNIILTSVNCLLDKNSKLLKEDNLIIYAAHYLSSQVPNMNSSNAYHVEKIIPHQNFNNDLDNNIAAIKVIRNIDFDDFIQPICLPERSKMEEGSVLGKVVGYGKSSMLTEIDFQIIKDDMCVESECQNFYGHAATAEGNIDLGCGLYSMNELSNHWTLSGILSMIPYHPSTNVTFTNVNYFIDWIEKLII